MTDGLENASREFTHDKITALIKARQERGWHVVFLGQGLNVARQGEAIGAKAESVAFYRDGPGLRMAGKVLVASSARYAKASHIKEALEEAGFTPEERDNLLGKKK